MPQGRSTFCQVLLCHSSVIHCLFYYMYQFIQTMVFSAIHQSLYNEFKDIMNKHSNSNTSQLILLNFHRSMAIIKRKSYFKNNIKLYKSCKIKVMKECSLKLKFKDTKSRLFVLFIYVCLFLQFQQMEAEFLIFFS